MTARTDAASHARAAAERSKVDQARVTVAERMRILRGRMGKTGHVAGRVDAVRLAGRAAERPEIRHDAARGQTTVGVERRRRIAKSAGKVATSVYRVRIARRRRREHGIQVGDGSGVEQHGVQWGSAGPVRSANHLRGVVQRIGEALRSAVQRPEIGKRAVGIEKGVAVSRAGGIRHWRSTR